MSMVSTIAPHHQVDLITPTFSFPPQRSLSDASRPHSRHNRNGSVNVLSLEPSVAMFGDSDHTLEMPNAEPKSKRSTGRRGAHAHRRSAAISHDLGDFKLALPSTPQRPKTMYSLQTGSGADSPPQYGLHPNASDSSLQLSVDNIDLSISNPKPRTQRVSFADVKVVTNDGDVHLSGANEPTSTASVHRVVSSRSFDSSEVMSQVDKLDETDDKSKRPRHKRVRSWAGNLIRFGAKKDERSKSTFNTPSSMLSKIDDLEIPSVPNNSHSTMRTPSPASSLRNVSPVVLPKITLNENSQSPASSPVTSERRYTWSESEAPLIDLDAALSPFRKSLHLDSEFGSNPFFSSHKRSESAPESVIAQGLRGLKAKKMGAVVEEAEAEEDEPVGKSDSSSSSPFRPPTSIKAPDGSPKPELSSLTTPSLDKPAGYLSSRYTKYVQNNNSASPVPGAAVQYQQKIPSSPSSLSSYRLQQAQEDQRDHAAVSKLKSGPAPTRTSLENLSPTQSRAGDAVVSPLNPDAVVSSSSVKVVKALSELEQIPSAPTTAIDAESLAEGKSFGEPGPELRCSIDTLQRAELRGNAARQDSYCGSISQRSIVSTSTGASFVTNGGTKRRSMPLRLFGWIKRR